MDKNSQPPVLHNVFLVFSALEDLGVRHVTNIYRREGKEGKPHQMVVTTGSYRNKGRNYGKLVTLQWDPYQTIPGGRYIRVS